MRLPCALAVLLALWTAAPARAGEGEWRQSDSFHFSVFHENPWLSGGFSLGLENLHSRLRRDLSSMAPWMSSERVKVYIYKDRASYLKGRFQPPRWSNGLAIPQERAVAVHEGRDKKKLFSVLAHELTHLIFESFWGKAGRPPAWLNEGLAMVEEAEAGDIPRSSGWHSAMQNLPPRSYFSMAELERTSPGEDLNAAQVKNNPKIEIWYTQSYSLVYFLTRQNSSFKFKSFCSYLRSGKSLKESLWLSYRYRSVPKFEEAWKKWLGASH